MSINGLVADEVNCEGHELEKAMATLIESSDMDSMDFWNSLDSRTQVTAFSSHRECRHVYGELWCSRVEDCLYLWLRWFANEDEKPENQLPKID